MLPVVFYFKRKWEQAVFLKYNFQFNKQVHANSNLKLHSDDIRVVF